MHESSESGDGSELTFGERLILAEEQRREQARGERAADGGAVETRPVSADRRITIQRKDFDATSAFVPQDDHHEFPLRGPGTLKQYLLITNQTDYSVTVVADGDTFLDENFNTLKEFDLELADVAAFQEGGNNVLEVSSIGFIDQLQIRVRPAGSLTVVRERASIDLEREV
ncbi:MAG: hypothetical protein ABEI98_03635 [Halorhabdus sp.]